MNKPRLTVLPQYTNRNDYPIGELQTDGSHLIIAEVHSCGGTEENQIKNAHKFAAWPEMYAALKVLTETPEIIGFLLKNDHKALTQAMAALHLADYGPK